MNTEQAEVCLLKYDNRVAPLVVLTEFMIYIFVVLRLQVPLEWGGKKVVEVVQWWENESDPQLNSNAYQEAQTLIQKHFPGPCSDSSFDQRLNVPWAEVQVKKTKKTCVNKEYETNFFSVFFVHT